MKAPRRVDTGSITVKPSLLEGKNFAVSFKRSALAYAVSSVFASTALAQNPTENTLPQASDLNSTNAVTDIFNNLTDSVQRLNECRLETSNIGIRLRNGESRPEDPKLLSSLEIEARQLQELITETVAILLESIYGNRNVVSNLEVEQYTIEQILELISTLRTEIDSLVIRRDELDYQLISLSSLDLGLDDISTLRERSLLEIEISTKNADLVALIQAYQERSQGNTSNVDVQSAVNEFEVLSFELSNISLSLAEIDEYMQANGIIPDPTIPYSIMARQSAISEMDESISPEEDAERNRLSAEANVLTERHSELLASIERLRSIYDSVSNNPTNEAAVIANEINAQIAEVNELTIRINQLISQANAITDRRNSGVIASNRANALIALSQRVSDLDFRLRANYRALLAANADQTYLDDYTAAIQQLEQLTLNPDYTIATAVEVEQATSQYFSQNYNLAHINFEPQGRVRNIQTEQNNFRIEISETEITQYNLGVNRFEGSRLLDNPNSEVTSVNTSTNVVVPGGSAYLTELALHLTDGIEGTQAQAAALNGAMFDNVEYLDSGWISGPDSPNKDIFGRDINRPFYTIFAEGEGDCNARAIYLASLLSAVHIPYILYYTDNHVGVAVEGVPSTDIYPNLTAFGNNYYILEGTELSEITFALDPNTQEVSLISF